MPCKGPWLRSWRTWRFLLLGASLASIPMLHVLLELAADDDEAFRIKLDGGPRSHQLNDVVDFASSGLSNITTRRLGKCALVGSGTAMLGAELGQEVDSHDTVIRINRLPTKRFLKDFGQRTTILFAGNYLEKQRLVDLMGGGSQDCDHLHRCGMEAIVVKGPLSVEARSMLGCFFTTFMRMQRQWRHFWKCAFTFQSVWQTAQLAVGVQRDALGHVVKHFPAFRPEPQRSTLHSWIRYLRYGPPKVRISASTGFYALITFLPVCDSLTLYGFRSSHLTFSDATSDGHRTTANHGGFQVEHALIHRLIDGNATHKDYPDSSTGAWLQQQFASKAGVLRLA